LRAGGQPLGHQRCLAVARRGREKSEAHGEAPVEKGKEAGTGKRFRRWGRRDEVRGENKGGRGRRGSGLVLEDPLVEVMRLFQGLNAQFALEEIPISAVLAEGLSPLTGLPVEAHEKAVNVLLERIEDEEALTGSYGLASLTPGNETLDETGQGAEKKQEESFSFDDQPLFKVGSVGNGEFGQKVPLIEVKGLTDPADTLRSRGKPGLQVLEARLEDLFKIADVYPAGGSGWDVDPRTLNSQTGFGSKSNLVEGATDVPKRATEVVASPRLRGFTPQQSGQVIAGEPLLGLAGQIDEESLLFLGQTLGDGLPSVEEPWLTQQVKVQCLLVLFSRHHPPS